MNEEAGSLDWTKSSGHVLSGRKIFDSYEDEFDLEPEAHVVGHKLGGGSSSLASARVLPGVAAYQRLLSASSTDLGSSHSSVTKSVERYNVQGTQAEPDPDDAGQDFIQENVKAEPGPDDNDAMPIDVGSAGFVASTEQNTIGYSEPVPDDVAKKSSVGCLEPDPDDSADVDMLNKEINGEHDNEPDPDDGTSEFVLESGNKTEVEMELRIDSTVLKSEPDPDDSSSSIQNQEVIIDGKHMGEPDPDASSCGAVLQSGNKIQAEIGQSRNHSVLESEPDPDDNAADLKSDELQRIEEPVAALCSRLQKAIEMLRSQATPSEAASALQTLFKIIKNVIENPNEPKKIAQGMLGFCMLCFVF